MSWTNIFLHDILLFTSEKLDFASSESFRNAFAGRCWFTDKFESWHLLSTYDFWSYTTNHRENGGKTLGMGAPKKINPIHTSYHVGIYWGPYPLLKGSFGGLKQLGYHPRAPAFSLWAEQSLEVLPVRSESLLGHKIPNHKPYHPWKNVRFTYMNTIKSHQQMQVSIIFLLGQWLNLKLFGITFSRENQVHFFFQGPLAEWVLVWWVWWVCGEFFSEKSLEPRKKPAPCLGQGYFLGMTFPTHVI